MGHCDGAMPAFARRGDLETAVPQGRLRSPFRVRAWSRSKAAPEERTHPEIPKSESVGIGREPEGVRRGLIVKGIPGIERQPKIGIAEAGEQGGCVGRGTGVGLSWRQGRRGSIKVTGIAVAFAAEQGGAGRLIRSVGIIAL